MTRSNTMTYTSRRSNHAESSTTGARRARQEVSDRDQTDEEDGTGNADGDDAEFHSRPTQQAGQTSTLGGGESHQSKAAARKKSEMGAAAYRRLVTDTIKMVLYATQRRQAIKKEDINKKVLSKDTAIWPAVFEDAQIELRERFGMELVELRSAANAEPSPMTGNADENETQRQAKGKKRANDDSGAMEPATKRKAAPGSKAWILRSTLSIELIREMNRPIAIDLPQDGNRRPRRKDCGALLAWDKGDGVLGGGVALKGVLFTLLAIILVRDRTISDSRFMKELDDRLNLRPETILPFAAADSPNPTIKFSEYLTLLVRQNYLQKARIQGVAGGHTAGQEIHYEWKWGTRAEAEIGEKAVCEFMLDIAADDMPVEAEADPAQRKKAAQERTEERKRLKSSIESAAGSALQGITPA